MRYGSVCSGIAPQTDGWAKMGLECAWFAEIEPFPSAVLAHRYPGIPNFGDFTRIGIDHGPIELLVGGTPCQSFSVAGKRAGLDDARGNLTIEFALLAGRLRPRWLVWENVPGILSIDEGRTFGAFLGMLGQLGYGFAWRILDAQYFGVAQRRRRVFLVGCLGDWRRAAAVLLERESLSGNPPPRRQKGEGTAHELAPCVGASGRGFERAGESRGQDCVVAFRFQRTDRFVEDDKVGSLAARDFKDGRDLITHALRADCFDASEDGTGRGTLLVPMGFYPTEGRDFVAYDEFSPSVKVGSGGNSGNPPAVAIPMHDMVNVQKGVRTGMAVRRLTPRECERLMGMPDDYTLVPWNGGMAKDGPRYKAIGNSWVVPVLNWIAARIVEVENLADGKKLPQE